MSRSCTICQHLKRPELDRRLAAGEPTARLARDYDLTTSSLYRHRRNCLKLGPSNAIKQEAARGSAALELLPGREALAGHYLELRQQIDQIVQQAQAQGSLSVALNGLNSVKRTLDSLVRLAGHDRPPTSDADGPSLESAALDVAQIAAWLIEAFDGEPEIKARIAKVLGERDDERKTAAAQKPHRGVAAPQPSARPAPKKAVATPIVLSAAVVSGAAASPIAAVASPIPTPPTTPVRTSTPAANVMGATGGRL